ncbi:MAG TPA: GNAT family N-acetyltransferase [Bacteroidales bacterium]|nr:GNAT family N-acetyltransferase [Bacteroidales bacterium]
MYLIPETDYWKALLPLSKVKVNHWFALFVLEKRVKGKVYADDIHSPSAFYVVHPYRMSLLFGSSAKPEFRDSLKKYLLNSEGERQNQEWLQAWPGKWNSMIDEILGDQLVITGLPEMDGKVVQNTRANFRFDSKKYEIIRRGIVSSYPVVPVDAGLYEEMTGTVVPKNFWNSAEDFMKYGAGFAVIIDGKPVCMSYSAYIFDGILEIGIETAPEHRGKGLALIACTALIDYCIQNGYEPVWSCRLQNTASYELAKKLGFRPTLTLPYYRLPV